MTTRDPFLDALAMPVAPRVTRSQPTATPPAPAAPKVSPDDAVRAWRIGPASPPDPHSPAWPHRDRNGIPVGGPQSPVPSIERGIADIVATVARPANADAIDAMVAEMVARGDVVFDAATDAYRAPHCRRFRFGEA